MTTKWRRSVKEDWSENVVVAGKNKNLSILPEDDNDISINFLFWEFLFTLWHLLKKIRESVVMIHAERHSWWRWVSSFFRTSMVKKNPDFPYASYPPFDLQDMEDSGCIAEFQVYKRDISSASWCAANSTYLPLSTAFCLRRDRRIVHVAKENLISLTHFTDLEKRTGNFGL